MPQCAHTFQVNCCLKVHNAHRKLLSPISGYAPRNFLWRTLTMLYFAAWFPSYFHICVLGLSQNGFRVQLRIKGIS